MEIKNRQDYENSKPYFTKENCPFCAKDLAETNTIIFESDLWYVIKNKYPYFGEQKKHILALPKKHSEFSYELSREEFADFVNVEKFIKSYFWEEAYFSFIRNAKWNKSVEHMHYHYLSGMLWAKEIDWEDFLYLKY